MQNDFGMVYMKVWSVISAYFLRYQFFTETFFTLLRDAKLVTNGWFEYLKNEVAEVTKFSQCIIGINYNISQFEKYVSLFDQFI